MTTGEVQLQNPSNRADWATAALLLLLFVPAVMLAFSYRPTIALAYFGLLAGIGLLAYPRLLFYLFVLSTALLLPTSLKNNIDVSPFDIILAALFGVTALEFLLRGETGIRATGLDLPFILLIAATIVSAVFAYDPSYSIVPIARIIIVYIAFRMAFRYAADIGVRRITLFYIYLVVAHSILNVIIFLAQGGRERVFGPAWLGYETLAMTALPMSFAYLIWAQRVSERAWFAVMGVSIGLGLLASGSRGPMLAVVVCIPILLFFAWRKARREKSATVLRIMRGILIPLVVLVALVVAFQETVFTGVIERLASLVDSLKNPQETVLLRLVLGKAAVRAFLSDPLTGIGIGNFRIVDQVVPEMRMEPVWFYIRGMSAHNVILHYLAETGLIGAVSLLALAFTGLRAAYRGFRRRMSDYDQQTAAAIFVGMIVFGVTLLYMRAWTWGQGGYIMAILFGLTAAWNAGPKGGPESDQDR